MPQEVIDLEVEDLNIEVRDVQDRVAIALEVITRVADTREEMAVTEDIAPGETTRVDMAKEGMETTRVDMAREEMETVVTDPEGIMIRSRVSQGITAIEDIATKAEMIVLVVSIGQEEILIQTVIRAITLIGMATARKSPRDPEGQEETQSRNSCL